MAYGHIAYSEISDHLNNVSYPIMAPLLYIQQSKLFDKTEVVNGKEIPILEPFYIPDKSELVKTSMTIADMIDMNYKKMMFKIINEDDIVEIYKCLTLYIRELMPYQEYEEAAKYIPKVQSLLEALKRPMVILSSKKPEVMSVVRRTNMLEILKELSNV